MDVISIVGLTVGVLGLLVSVFSTIYAIRSNRDKIKLEKIVDTKFFRLHAGIDRAHRITTLAYKHLDPIRRFLQDLPPSSERSAVLDEMTWLHGDITSADRLLKELREDIGALQKALYEQSNRKQPAHNLPLGGQPASLPPNDVG